MPMFGYARWSYYVPFKSSVRSLIVTHDAHTMYPPTFIVALSIFSTELALTFSRHIRYGVSYLAGFFFAHVYSKINNPHVSDSAAISLSVYPRYE